MGIRDIVDSLLKKKSKMTPAEEIQKKLIDPIQDEQVETTDEEIIRRIVEILNEAPPERRSKLIAQIKQVDEISSDILIESAVKAADSEKISDKVAVDLAKQASDQVAERILENAPISEDDRLAIIKTLSDNEKKEKAICDELELTYDSMKNLEQQSEFVRKVKKIIGISEKSDKINEELYKNIAKNLAFMYKETNGGMNLYQMEQLLPIQEMIKAKMPERIEQEYESLLEENEKNTFDLKDVKERFMDRLVKGVCRKAKEEEQPVSTFMKYIGEIDEEQTQALMKYIQKYTPNVSETELKKIQRIASGKEREAIYESDKRKSSSNTNGIGLGDIDIIQECVSSGLIKTLGKMNEQDRKKALETLNSSLEKRIEKQNLQKQEPTTAQVDKPANDKEPEAEGYGEI